MGDKSYSKLASQKFSQNFASMENLVCSDSSQIRGVGHGV